MRDILIRQTGRLWGTWKPTYTVDVGCKTFVFVDKDELIAQLDRYLLEPEQCEKDYYQNSKDGDGNPYGPSECECAVETPTALSIRRR